MTSSTSSPPKSATSYLQWVCSTMTSAVSSSAKKPANATTTTNKWAQRRATLANQPKSDENLAAPSLNLRDITNSDNNASADAQGPNGTHRKKRLSTSASSNDSLAPHSKRTKSIAEAPAGVATKTTHQRVNSRIDTGLNHARRGSITDLKNAKTARSNSISKPATSRAVKDDTPMTESATTASTPDNSTNQQLVDQLEVISTKCTELQTLSATQTSQIQQLNEKIAADTLAHTQLQQESAQQSVVIENLQHELDCCKQELSESQAQNVQQQNAATAYEQQISELQAVVSELRSKQLHDEQLRKRLHEQIQALKGNIRVFVRVRPLGGDTAGVLSYPPQCDQRNVDVVSATSTMHSFEYDRVFDGNAQQEDVFAEVNELVQSALDGCKVNLLAYGQTASGKTYTMEGPNRGSASNTSTDQQRGLIPRSVEKIFQTIDGTLQQQGWTYTCVASFLEIYNEQIRDLLVEPPAKGLKRAASSAGEEAAVKHEIKLVKEGKHLTTTVTNLTTTTVSSAADVYALLDRASKNRSVASTQSNDVSSRSHSVFTLKLTGNNTKLNTSTAGQLTLVDLAGSERIKVAATDNDAARLKETQSINKSLSALGDVIAAMANANGDASRHVPYRNSKLTYLLEPAFSARDSKTLMLVHVSAEDSHLSETVQSLRFAAKVNACQISGAGKGQQQQSQTQSTGNSTARSRSGSVVKL